MNAVERDLANDLARMAREAPRYIDMREVLGLALGQIDELERRRDNARS